MISSAHALAEHILRMPAHTNRGRWLRKQIADRVVNDRFINDLARLYDVEYPYADAPTEYLAEALKSYDQETI
jgi:hypothetical protein